MFNKSNFIRVVEFVKTIEPKHFNMEFFVKGIEGRKVGNSSGVKYAIKNSCGSSGCVIGHMPFIFPDVFEYQIIGNYVTVSTNDKYSNDREKIVNEILGIDDDEASYLFYKGVYYYGRERNTGLYNHFFGRHPVAISRNKEQQIAFMKDFYTYKTGEDYPIS